MYVAELLNRFIGNRISNVAILSTWPWIRKWNDRSINLLIPAAVGWNTVFLTAPLASICAIRTVVIITLLHSKHPKRRRSPKVAAISFETGQGVKARVNIYCKKPLDIFITAPRQCRFYLPNARETTRYNGISYRLRLYLLRVANFPFDIKFASKRARGWFARESWWKFTQQYRWEYHENRNETICGDWEYRRKFAGKIRCTL